MRAVKIKCMQEFANFRKPGSLQIKESYPLPPYSTVIGMVHMCCDFKRYVPMEVSVQGTSKGSTADMYTRYEFLTYDKSDLARHNMVLMDNGKEFGLYAAEKTVLSPWAGDEWVKYGVNRGTGYCETLVEVNMLFHVIPEDQSLVNMIASNLEQPVNFPALGRHEDILRIDSVSIVDISLSGELRRLGYDAYIPESYIEKMDKDRINDATYFKLNKVYSVDPKKGIRRWEKPIRAYYAVKNSFYGEDVELPVDSDGEFAFYA